MGGAPFVVRSERQPLVGSEAVEAFFGEVGSQRFAPPSDDIQISYLWNAILWGRENIPAVNQVLGSFAASQEIIAEEWTVGGEPAAGVVGRARTAIQYAALDGKSRISLPQTEIGWKREVGWLFRSPAKVALMKRVLREPTHTSRGIRYGPVEVLRQLGGLVNFIDAGCGVPEGPWQTQLKHEFPFPEIRFRFPDGREDRLATLGYASAVGRPALSGQILTNDLRSPADQLLQDLSLAAMRPNEILNSAARRSRRRMAKLGSGLGNILFVKADLTDKNSMAALRERCEGQDYRLVCLINVLHEVGQDNVVPTIHGVLDLLADHPDSQAIIAEHARIDRRRPHRLSLLPHWSKGTYGYFRVAKLDPTKTISHLMTCDTTRPESGVAGHGLFGPYGEELPMRDHLVRASAQS